jgi:hypothetical protein
MANIITAGNSTNGGTQIVTDTSGTLDIKTGTGSGTTAISIDASQNVTITGTISASGGVSGGIRSGTAVASTSGTSIDFTGIPAGVKRITVMFSGVSTNSTGHILVQIGATTTPTTTGYTSATAISFGTNNVLQTTSTAGYVVYDGNAANTVTGSLTIFLINTGLYISSHSCTVANGGVNGGGTLNLGSSAGMVRVTTTTGTDTFDAGTINIFYE